MAGRRIKRAEHLLGVAQFANWRGGKSSEALRVQSSRFGHLGGGGAGPSRGRADVSTADLANWCDRPHMRRGSTNQCNPRRRQRGDRRKGVSNVHCGAITSQSSRIPGVPHPHTAFAERNEGIPRSRADLHDACRKRRMDGSPYR